MNYALPFSGRTPESRAASMSGSACAANGRERKVGVYLDLLAHSGPLTDQEVAQQMNWPLSSVNSTRSNCGAQVQPQGFAVAKFSGRVTRRTRWGRRTE